MYRKYIKQYAEQLIKIKDLKNFIKFILTILNDKKIRFLIVGAYNTLVCYIFGLFYFKFFQINLTKITIFNVIVTIHSFLTHKFFSFRKKKYCYKEILRALISYGIMYALSATLILSLINFGFSQLFAYHLNLVVSLILFYLLHSYFTFK
jgi:putative flippase GtrA